jgi:hypothetical protein
MARDDATVVDILNAARLARTFVEGMEGPDNAWKLQ